MTDVKCGRNVEIVNSSNLPSKVVQYEQFLNDTLRGDLKYVNHSIPFIPVQMSHFILEVSSAGNLIKQ